MMVCYGILIVIFIVYNMFGITGKFELKDKKENLLRINNIKNYVSMQEDISCRVVINDMINFIYEYIFDGTFCSYYVLLYICVNWIFII